jgi:hypothetical protein
LPDAPRGLSCRTVLDLAEHGYDVGCGDILDRGGTEVGKHVPFQCMEHVIGVLFDPMPLVHAVPFAGDDSNVVPPSVTICRRLDDTRFRTRILPGIVCTENLIRVDDVVKSLKLAE